MKSIKGVIINLSMPDEVLQVDAIKGVKLEETQQIVTRLLELGKVIIIMGTTIQVGQRAIAQEKPINRMLNLENPFGLKRVPGTRKGKENIEISVLGLSNIKTKILEEIFKESNTEINNMYSEDKGVGSKAWCCPLCKKKE